MTKKEIEYLKRYFLITNLNDERDRTWQKSLVECLGKKSEWRFWLLVIFMIAMVPVLNSIGLIEFGEKYLR